MGRPAGPADSPPRDRDYGISVAMTGLDQGGVRRKPQLEVPYVLWNEVKFATGIRLSGRADQEQTEGRAAAAQNRIPPSNLRP